MEPEVEIKLPLSRLKILMDASAEYLGKIAGNDERHPRVRETYEAVRAAYVKAKGS